MGRLQCWDEKRPARHRGRYITMGAVTWRKAGVYVLLAVPVLSLAGHRRGREASGRVAAERRSGRGRRAESARAEEEREAQPKEVFTNDDVALGPGASAAGIVRARREANGRRRRRRRPAEPADGNATDAKAPKQRGEAGWRKRFAGDRAKISQAEQELDIVAARSVEAPDAVLQRSPERLPSSTRARTSPIRMRRSRRRKTKSPS